MKLLNVEVVLNREKGIQQAESEQDRILKELDDGTTSYAILSHRWGLGVEVTYEEMIGFMTLEDWKRDEVKKRYGYQKIIKCCEQAMKDGYKWMWIDTCCIDKRSSAELSEAINAMYRWYQNAQMCYAYLNDVDESVFPTEPDDSKFDQSNGWPEWFMRGWTLQELIAPEQVEFFNKDWVRIGNKQRLAPTLQGITGIPRSVLTRGLTGKRLSVAQIMSWAAERKTERVEDRAYSLMGLFGVNMPMLYGEGKNAFRRLQLKIIKGSGDHSIFAWGTGPRNPRMPRTGSVLAEDPSDFEDCGALRITKVAPDDFGDKLVEHIDKSKLGKSQRFDLLGRSRRAHRRKLAALREAANSQQFGTFTVSNTGIQVCLPVIPLPDSPSRFRAILPCTSLFGLATVDLVSSGSSFDRIAATDSTFLTYPEFKTLHLTHHQDVNEKRRPVDPVSGPSVQQPRPVPQLSKEEVSSMLRNAVLQAIRGILKSIPTSSFPIPAGTFYSSYVLPYRPAFVRRNVPGTDSSSTPSGNDISTSEYPLIDIKHSTYKSLAAFLKILDKQGILMIKDMKPEPLVMSVSASHSEVLSHTPYVSLRDKQLKEEKREKRDEEERAKVQEMEIKELWKPHTPSGSARFFAEGGLTLYTYADLKAAVIKYVTTRQLVNAHDQAYINVGQDEVLLSTVAGKNESGDSLKILKREEVVHRLSEKMQNWYEIRTEGQEPLLRKGQLKPISVPLLLEAEVMAEELRRICAGSTGVSPLPGKPTRSEVLVQGKQTKAVVDFLLSKGVPKKWIETADLTVKK
ncbi:heterokaryon incompatibility protein-domain-containing protein [Pisolithus marmoratus]|nr:heterokaryon incompatibility protein-domain-containing protein [Pisolithus marmoratus]